MRRLLPRVLWVLACFMLVPSLAHAQATLAGTVRDASGAILPGVTVEASSPALIEKSRTATTDGTGQYRITELPPGDYAVTFSLSGFTTIKRDGLSISGSGVIPVNVSMSVGTVQESVTVTGEAPLVDTQTVRREAVIKSETLSTLPATRGYGAVLTSVAGLQVFGNPSAQTTPDMTFFSAHGGASGEGRVAVDGLTVAAPFGGGGVSTFNYNTADMQEMQVLVSGGLGESETGGPSINLVPKSGGNTFSGSAFYSTAGDWSSSNNLDDRLRGFGLTVPATLRQNYDVSGSLGGPIKRDKLWFYGDVRNWANSAVVPGVFANKYAGDPAHWDYLKDPNVEGRLPDSRAIYAFRLTTQLTQKNRLSFYDEYQHRCSGSSLTKSGGGCRQPGDNWTGLGRMITASPESWPGYHDFPYNVTQGTWSAPVTGKVLLEAGFSRFHYGYGGFGMAPRDGLMDLIPVTELTGIYGVPNLTYRGLYDPLAFGYSDNTASPYTWRTSLSYVTGAHSMKIGYQGNFMKSYRHSVSNNTQMRYTLRAGDPISVTYTISPTWDQSDRTATTSIFAQDQWTMGRLTLQGALRYDRASSWAPAEGNGTTATSRFNPQPISFDRTVSVSGYNDLTPRMGAAIDVFGNGKTAVKVNAGRYLQATTADGIFAFNNPAARIIRTVGLGGTLARGWTDSNHNYVVDCNLLNPNAQNLAATGGDICAPLIGSARNFGNANPNTTTVNPGILGGWGVRPYDWQFGVTVQQQLVPRVSVEASYNRRWWGNFFVTDNTLVGPADYDTFTVTVPQHAGLPGAGTTATYVAIKPAAAALGAQNYLTKETDFAPARTSYWQGVDFTGTARLASGLTLQGGTSTGHGVRNTCALTKAMPELLGIGNAPSPLQRVDSCDVTEPWITAFRGLASYTVPKVDVLVSATFRSLGSNTIALADVATNGVSLNANDSVPNSVVAGSLGRLPAGGLPTGTTWVNLVTPGALYGPDRINQVDMRFAKILRFASRRLDIGIDLYNIFNGNDTTAYQQTFDYATSGATWLQPTGIVAPRFARFNATFSF